MRFAFINACAIMLAMFLALIAGTTADAQVTVNRSMPSIFIQGPKFTSDDVAAMNTILNLDETQRSVLQDLHAAYIADVEAARSEMTMIRDAANEEAQRAGSNDIVAELRDKNRGYSAYLDRLHERMIEDFKLMLTEDQLLNFEEFDRYYRRSRRLGSDFGEVRGSGVDLIAMVGAMEFEDEHREVLRPILHRYGVELDRFLVENDPEEIARRVFGDLEGIDEEGIQEMMQDPIQIAGMISKAGTMMDDMRKLSVKVRDINERTLRQIVAALPEDVAQRVEHDFRRRTFPEVYAETEIHAILHAVDAMDDLDAEQRSEFERIRQEYHRDAARLNGAWAAAIKSEDEKEGKGLFGGALSAMGAENDIIRRIRTDRNQLDDRTADQIRGLLNAQQRRRLPGADTIDWRSMGNWDDK